MTRSLIKGVVILLVLMAAGGFEGKTQQNSSNSIPLFEVSRINAVNTPYPEFAPVVYDGQLVFIGQKELDYLHAGQNRFQNNPYFSILSARIESESDSAAKFSKTTLFSKRLFSFEDEGPICFSPDGKIAVFTRTDPNSRGKDRVIRPKLYTAENSNGKWNNIQKLPFNRPDFSFGHPTISADGKMLVFSSDKEGGFGGKDLYAVQKNGEGWGEPENLGPEINSKGDEVYPYLHADGTLYFSSNGHKGFGGMDIFSADSINGKLGAIRNLETTINSDADDFGIFFNKNNKSGYFSSNRAGGKGSDDIFRFKVKWEVKGKQISGKFEYKTLDKTIPEGMEVALLDDDGEIMMTTQTDKNGAFAFSNLPHDQNYIVQIKEEDADIKLVLKEDGEVVAEMGNTNGKFAYRKLSYDEMAGLEMLYQSDAGMLKKSFSAKFNFDDLNEKYVEGTKVYLVDENGNILHETTTDGEGYFIFRDLPFEDTYLVKVDEYDPDMVLSITKDDTELASLISSKDGVFKFVNLPHQNSVKGKFQYQTLKRDVPAGMKVHLVNDQGEVVFTTITDENGNFQFNHLPSDRNYIVKIGEDNPDVMLILTEDGEELAQMGRDEKGEFVYKRLSYDQVKGLSMLYTEDAEMKANGTRSLFGRFQYKQLSADKPEDLKVFLVNEDGEIVFTTTTDKKGFFEFNELPRDQNYIVRTEKYDPNLEMIIIKDGDMVAKMNTNKKGDFVYVRLAPEAIGKLTMMKEKDASLILMDYTNSITAQFRYSEVEGNPAGMKLLMMDEEMNIIRKITTDKQGKIFIASLPPDETILFKIAEESGQFLSKGIQMDILDALDEMKIMLFKNKEGIFVLRKVSENELEATASTEEVEEEPAPELPELEKLYFETNSSALSKAAKKNLDKVARFLKEQKEIKLEVNAYADLRADTRYNLWLTERRARSVINYLVSKGIDDSRISGKGYGKSNPIVNCEDCSEEQHRLNRRAELKLYM